MSKPFNRIFKDCNLVDQPNGTYRDARNILYNKLKDSICNEGGKVSKATISGEVLGSVGDGENEIIFYKTSTNYNLIAEFNGTTLTTKIADLSNYLKFDVNYPIKSILIKNNKDERIVIWTDNLNPPRVINIDNPIVSSPIKISETNLLNLFPKSEIPVIDNVTVNSTGGSIPTGSYQFAVNYILDDNSETNYFGLSNFVRISKKSESLVYNKFTGEESGITTSKSISLKFTNIDTSYDKLRLAVVKYIKGVYSAELIDDYQINSSTLNITYTGSESSTDMLLEEIIVDNASYDTAKTINYANRNLYLANLTKESFPDYREYANNITAKWKYDESVALDTAKNSHKDPNVTYLGGSFMPNEVYAFYIAWKLKEGGYSPAFHIPGREAGLQADLTDLNTNLSDTYAFLSDDIEVSTQTRYFQTRNTSLSDGTMGFWENQNEYYDNDYPDFSDQKVRHHKFPSIDRLLTFEGGEFVGDIEAVDDDAALKLSVVDGEIEYTELTSSSYITITETQGILYKLKIVHDQETYSKIEWYFYAKAAIEVGASIKVYDSDDKFIETIYAEEDYVENGTASISQAINSPSKYLQAGSYYLIEIYSNSGISVVSGNTLSLSLRANTSTGALLNSRKLGVKFYNIETPALISDIVDGYEIFYAKRDIKNSLVAGQSVIFKEVSDSYNVISDITSDFATYPIDLMVNESYPSFNASYLMKELTIPNFSSSRKVFDELQDYNQVTSSDQLVPIESVEYTPYSNTYKKETYIKGTVKKTIEESGNTFLISLCQYLPNVYREFDSQQLVSTGYVGNGATTNTIYGDVYIGEVGLRVLPEYDNDTGGGTFGQRDRYGTYSYICFNRINSGLLKDDPEKVVLTYPFNKDIVDTPTAGSGYCYDLWDKLLSDVETPDFFDNYYFANTDYYRLNETNPVGHYNPNNTLDEFPNLIIKSSTNQNDENAKGLRTFLAANYYEMPKDKGEIINLESNGSTLLIHHKDGIYKTVSEVTLPTNEVDVTLGSGNIFRIEPQEILPTKRGYAGTQHPSSCLMTKGGYFFVDYKRGKIFLMSDKLEEISNYGLKRWFETNLPFNINNQLKEFGKTELTTNYSKYGIGFNVVFDDRFNRIILTKRDYSIVQPSQFNLEIEDNKVKYTYQTDTGYFYPEFNTPNTWIENKSWTISYSLETNTWCSYHDYVPYYQFGLTNNLYYVFSDTICENNVDNIKNDNNSYVDFVFNEMPSANKQLASINWNSEYYDSDGYLDKSKTFDEAFVLNSYQHSGDTLLDSTTDLDARNLAYSRGQWNFNGFRDLNTDNPNDTLTTYETNRYYLKTDKKWYDKKRFIDKYNVVRLQNNNTNANTLYLSSISVSQRISPL